MSHPLLIFSQSDYLILIVALNLHTQCQTVQIQISWLLQKPTDLDLHCLQRQVYPGSAGQGLRSNCQLIRLLDSGCWWKFTYLMTNRTRSQLIWIYTVCKGRIHPGSVGPGLYHSSLRGESSGIYNTVSQLFIWLKTFRWKNVNKTAMTGLLKNLLI